MTSKTILSFSLILLGVAIILFSTGSLILTKSLFGIPFGNIVLWIGLVALQVTIYKLNKGFKASHSIIGKAILGLMVLLIGICIFWFGIAYFLSGNVCFNFSSEATSFTGSPKASIFYWNIIYTLIIAPIVLMLVYHILLFIEKRK